MDTSEARKILNAFEQVPHIEAHNIKQKTIQAVSDKLQQEDYSIFMKHVGDLMFWVPNLTVDDAVELLLSLGMFIVAN